MTLLDCGRLWCSYVTRGTVVGLHCDQYNINLLLKPCSSSSPPSLHHSVDSSAILLSHNPRVETRNRQYTAAAAAATDRLVWWYWSLLSVLLHLAWRHEGPTRCDNAMRTRSYLSPCMWGGVGCGGATTFTHKRFSYGRFLDRVGSSSFDKSV